VLVFTLCVWYVKRWKSYTGFSADYLNRWKYDTFSFAYWKSGAVLQLHGVWFILMTFGQLTGIVQWIYYICVCCCWCQDEIVSSERDQYLMLFHLYLPVFMQLVNILLTKVRMPADNEYRSWNDGTCDISMLTVALSNVFMCLAPLRWSISVACCLSLKGLVVCNVQIIFNFHTFAHKSFNGPLRTTQVCWYQKVSSRYQCWRVLKYSCT